MSSKLKKIKAKAKRLGIKGEIVPAKNPKKKYSIIRPNGKVISFGDSSAEDYWDHKDAKRRKSYLARAKGIKNKEGKQTYKDPNSANYYSVHLLW